LARAATKDAIDSVAFRARSAFPGLDAWTVDLLGTLFLEVVDKLYKRNELAIGALTALGRRINHTTIKVPVFLLAAHR
jgi:poly(3-hydroxybutyrate) depolymerase